MEITAKKNTGSGLIYYFVQAKCKKNSPFISHYGQLYPLNLSIEKFKLKHDSIQPFSFKLSIFSFISIRFLLLALF